MAICSSIGIVQQGFGCFASVHELYMIACDNRSLWIRCVDSPVREGWPSNPPRPFTPICEI
jgi:hypothetical protein